MHRTLDHLDSRDSDEALRERQRARGICSEPDCVLPIAGWCDTCNARGPFKAPKWCEIHLSLHCGLYGHTAYYPYAPGEREGRARP